MKYALLLLLLVACAPPLTGNVDFETVDKGSQGPEKDQGGIVLRSQEEMQDAGLNYSLDFNEYMLVAVFQGTKNTGGYSIEITRIEANDNLDVYVEQSSPPEGAIVTQVITHPLHVVKIPQSPKEVEFHFS